MVWMLGRILRHASPEGRSLFHTLEDEFMPDRGVGGSNPWSATAFPHTNRTYDISSNPSHEAVHFGRSDLTSYALNDVR